MPCKRELGRKERVEKGRGEDGRRLERKGGVAVGAVGPHGLLNGHHFNAGRSIKRHGGRGVQRSRSVSSKRTKEAGE